MVLTCYWLNRECGRNVLYKVDVLRVKGDMSFMCKIPLLSDVGSRKYGWVQNTDLFQDIPSNVTYRMPTEWNDFKTLNQPITFEFSEGSFCANRMLGPTVKLEPYNEEYTIVTTCDRSRCRNDSHWCLLNLEESSKSQRVEIVLKPKSYSHLDWSTSNFPIKAKRLIDFFVNGFAFNKIFYFRYIYEEEIANKDDDTRRRRDKVWMAAEHFDVDNADYTAPKQKRICAHCKIEKTSKKDLRTCSKCRLPSYCSKRCQKKHWRHVHKLECVHKGCRFEESKRNKRNDVWRQRNLWEYLFKDLENQAEKF